MADEDVWGRPWLWWLAGGLALASVVASLPCYWWYGRHLDHHYTPTSPACEAMCEFQRVSQASLPENLAGVALAAALLAMLLGALGKLRDPPDGLALVVAAGILAGGMATNIAHIVHGDSHRHIEPVGSTLEMITS